MEEVIEHGSYGERLNSAIIKNGLNVKTLNVSLPNVFVEHGTIAELRQRYQRDEESVYQRIKKQM